MAEVITDMMGVLRGTFLNGDWIGLLIAFGSVVIASLMMQRGSQIGSMTLLALALFAAGGLLRNFFAGPGPTEGAEGGRAMSQVSASFNAFLDQPAGALVAYFLAFMLLIFLLFSARTLIKGN
jgi:hypothetical protein